ncbi:MAG: MarP family serine protease [Corynebacteriales bacterium]|nr:MarP family serine protease [Mycobacteriales bacterium]
MRGSALDLILLAMGVLAGFVGYRRGFLLGILSFAGFLAGALTGLQIAPLAARNIDGEMAPLVVGLAIVFGLALIGQIAAFMVGAALRDQLRSQSARVVDGIGGSIVSVLAVFIVAWMVAAPLASAPEPWLASQVRRSAVLHTVDATVPDPVRGLYGTFADAVRDSEFPEIFDGLTPSPARPVAAPDPELQDSPVVDKAHRSVVKVLGEAPSCDRRSEGTGFVYAPNRVMTNAHVVAGTKTVKVELYDRRYQARVVHYDPQLDLAVLYVPDLDAPALDWAPQAERADDAIVVGYPLDGPYTAVSARVRDRQTIRGPDIYGESTVHREVYSIRSQVRPGNSGGPMISPSGQVYGVIFAAAADDPETGYALTAAQAQEAAIQGTQTTRAVDTQSCD